MKTIKATGKHIVSFNTRFGDDEVGDSGMDSVDHAGDDIDALAAEVIADDPSFPMTFVRNEGSEKVVGRFYNEDDDGPCALMIVKAYF